jgi:hypothetical protein
MKLNRTKLIEEFDTLRQGFADVLDFTVHKLPKADQWAVRASVEAYHKNADRCVVELGGESVNRKYKTKGMSNVQTR